MEPLSVFSTIINTFKNWGAIILKKAGYKITRADDYQEESVEVDLNYPASSPTCKEEESSGATFRWSEKYRSGYEKYFEISENKKRYFEHRRQILWIKRK